MTTQYKIVDGPNREDIIRSWQSMGDDERFLVHFVVAMSGKRRLILSIAINGMDHTDDNGQSFRLRGPIRRIDGFEAGPQFVGFEYTTRGTDGSRRSGTIDLTTNQWWKDAKVTHPAGQGQPLAVRPTSDRP